MSFLHMLLDGSADSPPARVAAFHEFCIEALVAQRDGCFATNVKSISAEYYDRIGLRQFAGPFLHALGVLPRRAIDDVLRARNKMPRARIDELHRLARIQH